MENKDNESNYRLHTADVQTETKAPAPGHKARSSIASQIVSIVFVVPSFINENTSSWHSCNRTAEGRSHYAKEAAFS